MAKPSRPLSPHLHIYKPQITSVLSILHRITGVILSFGTLILVYWLVAAAGGEESYKQAMDWLTTTPAQLILAAFSFAFFYHFFNGIRHLFWDVGYGFEIRQVVVSGWTTVIAAFVVTGVFWALVLDMAGGGS